MEAWQIAGLVSGLALIVLLWPAAKRIAGSGAPVLRWALLWAAAIAGVMLIYAAVLEPMGIGLR